MPVPIYSHCKVFAGSEPVMYAEKPMFNLVGSEVQFSRAVTPKTFGGNLVGSVFSVEFYNSLEDSDPALSLYEAGITTFGFMELKENSNGRYVEVADITFEFGSYYDPHGKFAEEIVSAQHEALEQKKIADAKAELERIEKEKNALHEGDKVWVTSQYTKMKERGEISRIFPNNNVQVAMDNLGTNGNKIVRYVQTNLVEKINE